MIIAGKEVKYSYLKYPNLPENKVAYVVLGQDNAPLLKKPLKKHNINICSLEGDLRLDKRVSNHTDMIFFHLGSNHIILSKNAKLPFEDTKITVSTAKLDKNYPCDVALNAVMLGKNLICNKKYTDNTIIKYANKHNLNIIDVNQGYSKCSVTPISENALVTDDIGISNAAREAGIDTLYLDKRCVVCDGFDYGFIGGASGMIDKNILAFTGIFTDNDIKTQVESFAEKHGVEIEYLTDKPMFDVGSIIPFIEVNEEEKSI